MTDRPFFRAFARAAVTLALALLACSAQPLRAQPAPEAPRAQPAAERPRAAGPPANRESEDRWWRDHALLPRLDLEPARRARLEETYATARTHLDTLNAAVIAAEAELAAVTHAIDPDERAFAPRLDRMVAAHEQFEKEHAGLLLTVRGLLTPAQWSRLQELQRTLGGPGPGGEPPRTPGMGGDARRPSSPGPGPRDEGSHGGPATPGGARQGRPPGDVRPPDGSGGPDGPRPGAPASGPRAGQLPPGPPLPPGTWWRDPEVAARLGVDPLQVEALDAAFEARRDSLADARGALEREERALGSLLPAPTLDLDAALAASQRVAHARAQLDRAFLDLRFAQWRALRPDQRERLLHPPPR